MATIHRVTPLALGMFFALWVSNPHCAPALGDLVGLLGLGGGTEAIRLGVTFVVSGDLFWYRFGRI